MKVATGAELGTAAVDVGASGCDTSCVRCGWRLSSQGGGELRW